MFLSTLNSVVRMVLAFPLDWLRLTIHSWEILLESLHFRIKWKAWEHPCIFCRDLDKSRVPRNMSGVIRYRNVWMIRLLQPELKKAFSRQKNRGVPICHNDSGNVPSHVIRALILGLVTLGGWVALVYGWLYAVSSR